jgi:HD-GYP domain-containing protein (c-di-GMP phosphodiesterase class II)
VRRTAELSCAIAHRLGWDEEAIEMLRIAAAVHDIGKIAAPAEILSKPGRLTEAEFQLVKVHPRVAHDILAPTEIALQHHERLDGSGYPRGLKGDDILPQARIIAVADVVEAMVSHRPYRPALPVSVAVEEIRSGLGTRYDAAVGQACLDLLEGGFRFAG